MAMAMAMAKVEMSKSGAPVRGEREVVWWGCGVARQSCTLSYLYWTM